MLTANEIRRQFIDFFVKKHGHTFVPSSSVVPHDDPTLLFSNAGMNQFKPYFLGTEKPPFPRAANTQKCIRAGGKHNDLDDVGKDTYHHTFFEMLGNWSFGDYFKKEAIRWAWELLTDVWKLDKTRLHATVFEGDPDQGLAADDEAAALWRSETDINPANIHLGNKKDNFWEMGETGPCGPCTEIHIDRTPNKTGGKLVNAGTPDVIEIWNLVFIQFNRGADKKLTPLPAKHVDTGMGFERVTAVLQRKGSNYDTDVFTPIFDAISEVTSKKYSGKLDDMVDVGFRVIADHLRMATFAITDGARPGNKKRDAVLRSVIRRAVRFGYQYFELREPFLHRLVSVVTHQMGTTFPELIQASGKVEQVLQEEEQDFFKTIRRGLSHFQRLADWADEIDRATPGGGKRVISGHEVADLQTTYGFPFDLTKQMAEERGITIDEGEYRESIKWHKAVSGKGRERIVVTAVQGELPKTDDSLKYLGLALTGQILGWVENNTVSSAGLIPDDRPVGLVLDQTSFYAEQGGQVGDLGIVSSGTDHFVVEDTQKLGDSVLHIGRLAEGTLKVGQHVKLAVFGPIRLDTMRNHTATHLLNWALRKVLGDHIEQKGSYVDAEKTRFDFAHDKPLSAEEIAEVERLVNEQIYADLPVTPIVMPLAEAKKIPGVRAVFGEKYPDPVRVLIIGADADSFSRERSASADLSIEFCGGTHLNHTGQAGFFKIVSQELVGKGVRRVTAVTGREAVATVQRLSALLDNLASRFNCKPEEVPARVESMQEEMKKLQVQMRKGAAGDAASAADRLLADAKDIDGVKVIVGEMPAVPLEQMRTQMDRLRQKAKSCAVLVGWSDEGKVGLLASMTEDVVKKGLDAGKLIGEVAKVVGGKGGGRKEMAQAGGSDPAKLAEALALAKKLVVEKLGG